MNEQDYEEYMDQVTTRTQQDEDDLQQYESETN